MAVVGDPMASALVRPMTFRHVTGPETLNPNAVPDRVPLGF
jgi:hypothetical protein